MPDYQEEGEKTSIPLLFITPGEQGEGKEGIKNRAVGKKGGVKRRKNGKTKKNVFLYGTHCLFAPFEQLTDFRRLCECMCL